MKIIVLGAAIALAAGCAASAQDMHYQVNRNASRVDSYSSHAIAESRQGQTRPMLLAAPMLGYRTGLYSSHAWAPLSFSPPVIAARPRPATFGVRD